MSQEIEDQAEGSVGFVKPRASHRILDPLRDRLGHEATQDLNNRLYEALQHFPELNEYTVTLAWLHPESKDTINGRAFSHNRIVCLPSDEYTSNVTLYHELGHLAIWELRQQSEDHPKTSEEYCSIFSMARMPPNAVDEQRVPYLGKSPLDTTKFPEICQRALDYRENHRNYIQQCKGWLQI